MTRAKSDPYSYQGYERPGCVRYPRFLPWLIAVLLAVGVPALAPAAENSADLEFGGEAWEQEVLAAGVTVHQRHFDELFQGPQFISIIEVDIDAPGVNLRFSTANELGESAAPLSKIAENAGAIAASNGGFAHGGPRSVNSGIIKIDGEVLPFLAKEPEELRFVGAAALGIDEDGDWRFRNRPDDEWPEDWPEVRHALAGGHRLIEEGEIHPSLYDFISSREERHAGGTHPRTAIGLRPDNVAILITVDGRHPEKARGVTLLELAGIMEELGCVEALNLDGGGSTTLWLRDRGVANHPSGNRRFDSEGVREVRSAVIIRTETSLEAP